MRREMAIGLGSYAAYLFVRQAVWTDDGRARATGNAQRIVGASSTEGTPPS